MKCGDPWVTGWAAAAGLALLCLGLALQLHIKDMHVAVEEPVDLYQQTHIEPDQYKLAYDLLEHSYDSVVHELDSIRAICPEQEGDR